jgi:BlaI family penicillinase repressor
MNVSVDITESELIVMNALWRASPLRSREIVEATSGERKWHRKTVNTLIRRLVEKDAISYEEALGGFLYHPAITQESYRQRQAKRLIKDLFGGEVSPLLSAFVETEKLSDSDLGELRSLIERLSQ